MNWQEPARCLVALGEGVLAGATGRYAKRLVELQGLYADEAAFAAMLPGRGETVVYEVTEFRPSGRSGDMIFGITRMVPGQVGREFFMTRGHIHARADRPEVYYGQKGHGLMLMESPEGEIRTVEIAPQTICYVPPFWIHRSVNVGAEDLVMMFSYPADAGQDYEIIARSGGMRVRIVADGSGRWTQVDNRSYRRRSADEIGRLAGLAS